MLKVLEHILMTWPAPQPEYKALNDAIKDLQTESMVELHRLASKMPDHLLVRVTSITLPKQHLANWETQEVYDQLEVKVRQMIASGALDEKRQLAYQSFLFIIM
jgi:exportin-5